MNIKHLVGLLTVTAKGLAEIVPAPGQHANIKAINHLTAISQKK
ncbi:hypothetical protein [Methylosoma difficile]